MPTINASSSFLAASILLPLHVLQPLCLFSFRLLPSEYSSSVGFPLFFLARTNIRPRPAYSAWCLICPLLFGRGFEAGVAHSGKNVVCAWRGLALTIEVQGLRIRIRPNGMAGADLTAIYRREADLSSRSSGMLLPAMVLR